MTDSDTREPYHPLSFVLTTNLHRKRMKAGRSSLTSDIGISEGEGRRTVALGTAAVVVVVIVVIIVIVVRDAALGVDAALQTVTLVADADAATERVAEAALLACARERVWRVRAVSVVTAWITHALVGFCGKDCYTITWGLVCLLNI